MSPEHASASRGPTIVLRHTPYRRRATWQRRPQLRPQRKRQELVVRVFSFRDTAQVAYNLHQLGQTGELADEPNMAASLSLRRVDLRYLFAHWTIPLKDDALLQPEDW